MRIIETRKYAQNVQEDAMATMYATKIMNGGNRNQVLTGVSPAIIALVDILPILK